MVFSCVSYQVHQGVSLALTLLSILFYPLSPLLSCYLKGGLLGSIWASHVNPEGADPVMVFQGESSLIPVLLGTIRASHCRRINLSTASKTLAALPSHPGSLLSALFPSFPQHSLGPQHPQLTLSSYSPQPLLDKLQVSEMPPHLRLLDPLIPTSQSSTEVESRSACCYHSDFHINTYLSETEFPVSQASLILMVQPRMTLSVCLHFQVLGL